MIGAIQHLNLTHLRLVVYYNIDLVDENAPAYSKGFVRSLREHNPSSVAAALMEAVPTLRYVFLTFGGQYEVSVQQYDEEVKEDRTVIGLRGHWMTSSGWASVEGEGAELGSKSRAGPRPFKKLGDEVAEKAVEDEGLLVSREDEVSWCRASSGDLNSLTALLVVDDGNAPRMEYRRDCRLGTVGLGLGVKFESRISFPHANGRAFTVYIWSVHPHMFQLRTDTRNRTRRLQK